MNLNVNPAVATAALPPTFVPCPGPQPGLILLGRDERGRPHASAFGPEDATAAERAAALMGFTALIVAEEHQGLASSLPKGRIFDSGKAFVPFCSTQTFARLLEAAGLPDTPVPVRVAAKPAAAGASAVGGQGRGAGGSGAGDPPATRAGTKAPADHSQICIGSRVLAEDEAEGGYYPAEVVATKADDHFQLVWAGYPDLPEFSRSRRALALLYPEVAEAAE
ncbi:hypothetical protein [Methylobacterium radiodurans]|uniref:hypothetical protein n=1 Tax=Methylobacterium radiodurans TaxID=2202828 RepID=UPI001FE35920|nr:hypothetical protein [Methylobacterium radiodurans]